MLYEVITIAQLLVVYQHALGVVPGVEFAGQVLEVEGDHVRRQVARRAFDDFAELA